MTDIEKFLILQIVTGPDRKSRRKYQEGYYDAIREVYNFVKQMEENMSKEMTAVEYFRTKKRMSDGCANSCIVCPLGSENNGFAISCDAMEMIYPKQAAFIVQKWSEQHPVNTRQSEFLKLYPNAAINDGAIKLCPHDINTKINCKITSERISCNTCRKEYWLKEVKK